MAAGKTTCGRLLAERLDRQTESQTWKFADLDDYIEEFTEQSVPSLFETRGEEGFRLLEQQCLNRLISEENPPGGLVIALGGGTPCRPGMIEELNAVGTTVYLRLSPESLSVRLDRPEMRDGRPLLQADLPLERQISDLLQERERFYAQSKIILDVSAEETPEETVSRICRELSFQKDLF